MSVCRCGTEVDLVPLHDGRKVQVELGFIREPAVGLMWRLNFGDRRPFYSRLTEANIGSAHRGPYRRPHADHCAGREARS